MVSLIHICQTSDIFHIILSHVCYFDVEAYLDIKNTLQQTNKFFKKAVVAYENKYVWSMQKKNFETAFHEQIQKIWDAKDFMQKCHEKKLFHPCKDLFYSFSVFSSIMNKYLHTATFLCLDDYEIKNERKEFRPLKSFEKMAIFNTFALEKQNRLLGMKLNMKRLPTFSIHSHGVENFPLTHMVESPYFGHLRFLQISNFRVCNFSVFFSADHFPNLKYLFVSAVEFVQCRIPVGHFPNRLVSFSIKEAELCPCNMLVNVLDALKYCSANSLEDLCIKNVCSMDLNVVYGTLYPDQYAEELFRSLAGLLKAIAPRSLKSLRVPGNGWCNIRRLFEVVPKSSLAKIEKLQICAGNVQKDYKEHVEYSGVDLSFSEVLQERIQHFLFVNGVQLHMQATIRYLSLRRCGVQIQRSLIDALLSVPLVSLDMSCNSLARDAFADIPVSKGGKTDNRVLLKSLKHLDLQKIYFPKVDGESIYSSDEEVDVGHTPSREGKTSTDIASNFQVSLLDSLLSFLCSTVTNGLEYLNISMICFQAIQLDTEKNVGSLENIMSVLYTAWENSKKSLNILCSPNMYHIFTEKLFSQHRMRNIYIFLNESNCCCTHQKKSNVNVVKPSFNICLT